MSRALTSLLAVLIVSPLPALAVQRVFFDDAETGTAASKWDRDGTRPMCRYVTSSRDGVLGPFSGSKMIECDDPGASWETLKSRSFSMNNEVFYRVRVRVDNDNDDTGGSARKVLRIFYFTGDRTTYVDVITVVPNTGPGETEGLYSDVIIDDDRHPVGPVDSMYWGNAVGDNSKNNSVWHTVEYYLNKATGLVRIWHDDVLVQSGTFGPIGGAVGSGGEFYITSNWGDAHDSANHVYFDNVEIFTDTGAAPVTGTLVNGDVQLSSSVGPRAAPAPTQLQVH